MTEKIKELLNNVVDTVGHAAEIAGVMRANGNFADDNDYVIFSSSIFALLAESLKTTQENLIQLDFELERADTSPAK